MISGHGGNVFQVTRQYHLPEESILDFSASINPLPIPKTAIQATEKALEKLRDYPDIAYTELLTVIGERYGILAKNLLVGNGSTEHIYLLPQVLKPKKACIVVPSYNDYTESFRRFSGEISFYFLKKENGFHLDFDEFETAIAGCDVVVLGSPNNPTGIAVKKAPLLDLIKRKPETMFVVDEAFMDFLDDKVSIAKESTELENLIVLRSLTKFYGIPGLRLGILSTSEKNIASLKKVQEPWTVNCFAEAIGIELLKDVEFQQKTRETIRLEREWLYLQLSALKGITPLPSDANFIFIKIEKEGMDSEKLWDKLTPLGILIRRCGNFRGLDASYFRIAIRLRKDNEALINALRKALG